MNRDPERTTGRWLEVLAIAALAAGTVEATAPGAAHAAIEAHQVETRVLAVRERLAQLTSESQDQAPPKSVINVLGPVAQWPNWSNGWYNWGNWRNW